jgi:hypothetical protein
MSLWYNSAMSLSAINKPLNKKYFLLPTIVIIVSFLIVTVESTYDRFNQPDGHLGIAGAQDTDLEILIEGPIYAAFYYPAWPVYILNSLIALVAGSISISLSMKNKYYIFLAPILLTVFVVIAYLFKDAILNNATSFYGLDINTHSEDNRNAFDNAFNGLLAAPISAWLWSFWSLNKVDFTKF